MHVGPDFAICIMHVLSAASGRVQIINAVSCHFVAAGSKFRCNFVLLRVSARIYGTFSLSLSLRIRNGWAR